MAHLPTGHVAARDARRRRRAPAGVHPAHRRLHHRERPGRREGQHGRRPGGQPVQHGTELGAGLGDGGDPDLHDPGLGGDLRRDRSDRARADQTVPAGRVGGGAGVSTAALVRPRRDPVNGLLLVWGILVFAFLFLPIVMIVIYSFNDGRALVVWHQFGFAPYGRAVSNPTIRGAVFTSVRAALGASVIATVVGSLAGIALARRPGKWTIGFLARIFLVLVTPEVVDAISLLIWYVRIGGPFGPANTLVNY